jgi:hypothetical protein
MFSLHAMYCTYLNKALLHNFLPFDNQPISCPNTSFNTQSLNAPQSMNMYGRLYTGKYLHIEAAHSPRKHLPIHQTTRCCVPDHILTGTSNPT